VDIGWSTLVTTLLLAHPKGDDLVKKVRYALGAAGLLPALGLAAPPATAAAHTPARTGKTVAVHLTNATANTFACTEHHDLVTESHSMNERISWSQLHGCVGLVSAFVHGGWVGGFSMRARFYSPKGTRVAQILNPAGHLFSSPFGGTSTAWLSRPLINGVAKVCVALVQTDHSNTVFAGPVCEKTTYTG
jgi:hypothetical protein